MNTPKKVLIITYYWPPAGGPGVQRWLKFVKYLPEFHIEPIVYVPENPSYPLLDNDLQKDVNENVTILKNKIFEPYQLASFLGKKQTKKMNAGIITKSSKQTWKEKFLLWVRGNLFIPDARVFWVNSSVKFLKKYISENQIDTIITSGPPHSLHLIGLKLKKQNPKIKWISDFRDPWTTIGYHKELKLSAWAEKKHKNLEKNVLQISDEIIVTSPRTKLEFQNITSKNIHVITNGFDKEIIENIILDTKFTLAHIGSLLSERNPIILWESLGELIQENLNFATHFSLKLVGAISDEVLKTIDQFIPKHYIDNKGYVSHNEALVEQRKSQILLIIEINSKDTKCIIPGKVFEYINSERPIIAIGPNDSDFEDIITETKTGFFFNYDQKSALKNQILNYFEDYLNQNLKVSALNLEKYTRLNLTEKLSQILHQN